jgi:DNA mismatch repair protein MutS2
MTTIIRILDVIEAHAATHHGTAPHTLVLLDELGAGTDPVEGAALARAILSRLLERGCLGIFTTHYAELKAFAYNTPGVQNASVEFDIETLAPTYRLMIGLPGRSNALAIAARLGMDAALVEHARSTITHEAVQIEDLLADIHREREAAAAALQRSREVQEDAEKYRERLANELDDLEATREERIDAAYQQAEEELRDVRTEIARLRNDMRSLAHSRQEAQHAEERLQAAEAAVRQRKNEAVRKQRSERAAQHAPRQQEPRPLQVGDTVHVRSVGLSGEILTIDEEEQSADVQVGGFRMHVPLRELRRDKAPKQKEHASAALESSAPSLPAVPDVSMNLDMRGSRAAEVSPRLDRYLNDAYLAGLSQVHLIHGKGSGVLRQVVRDVLRKHPLVASFDSGGREHDDGMTVARLVER